MKKATVSGVVQEAAFKGIGWEFEPLIVVVQSDLKVRLMLDPTESDNPDDTYWLVSFDTGDVVASVQGERGMVETELTLTSTGGYALVKGNRVVGAVESVSDLTGVDMQSVRERYVAGN